MKVVTFGELMLRLEPEGYYRFVQAERLTSTFGGAEANVAVSLANFGVDSVFVTKLPRHEIGQSALNSLRRYGVNTDFIARGGERLGIYYNERGASQRPSKCIYDRKGSSFAESTENDYDFKTIFNGAEWFHLTGITPAVSACAQNLCVQACKAAKKAGCFISFDVNYRSSLWSESDAKKAVEKLTPYIDLCICNEEDAGKVFGIRQKQSEKSTDIAFYKNASKTLVKKYGFKNVAFTLRTSVNANQNSWSALFYDGKKFFKSATYDMMIVDRVGGGDSFAAGLIYAMLNKKSAAESVQFASAAACLKHSIEGDFNAVSVQEVEYLVKGNGTGRILR